MSTPKGTTCRNFALASRDQLLLYHNTEQIILQLRRQVATEENILNPSFKVAVELSPIEAIALAAELLNIAVPRVQTLSREVEDHNEKSNAGD